MQPPCSLQLGPCGPSPSLASQGSSAGIHQLEEKQLFEKFWKGTFKAVATPRPESVIVASITARRRVTNFSGKEPLFKWLWPSTGSVRVTVTMMAAWQEQARANVPGE
ncbi:Serine/arginine repetitive matrix protein 4 [Collichthys lucidus]|uniref:Serine/arginine repetitive matrix protein 4 n=1 Tax=Collichthys lucidus TaxID=240159 RepID=A0A4U5UTV4_COLLU|nr:Serine/arginine repetitive matrix protein 4 [Collichthys lucidus]